MPALLEYRAWTDLRSTAHAHGLTFHTRQPKAQVYQRLVQTLVQDGVLRRRWKALGPRERRALRTLQQAGGYLSLAQFQRRYGNIRIYRPWRADATPRFPYKRPQSAAERLWYWGFIEISRTRPRQVVLPDEVLALLPALPRPRPVQPSAALSTGDTLVRDVAALLRLLLAQDVRPLHGRWLPPRMLRLVQHQLHAPSGENSVPCRSELQTGRLRFLHYLAEAAGLIALQDGLLKPTVQAWRWFDLPSEARWQTLWQAIGDDLRLHARLWERYRLPLLEWRTWNDLTAHPDGAYWAEIIPSAADRRVHVRQRTSPVRSGAVKQKPRRKTRRISSAGRPRDPSAISLTALLSWMGWTSSANRGFRCWPRTFAPDEHARVCYERDAIHVLLPPLPHLRPLAVCALWAEIDGSDLYVDAAALRRAVAQGQDALSVATALADLCGAPLSPEAYARLRTWAAQAQALTLRPVLLLSTPDTALMTRIRSDWRLRPLLGELLSPHHLAVPADHAAPLLRALRRRGTSVTASAFPAPPRRDSGGLSPELAAYGWLAMRVYQKLGALVAQDVPIAASIRDGLAHDLSAAQIESLEQVSSALLERLTQTLRGHAAAPPVRPLDDPDAIQAAVQSAYEHRTALKIAYFSPAQGETTVRTIEPILLYERQGATYIEAWCRRDEAVRTFRQDRILRVITDDDATG